MAQAYVPIQTVTVGSGGSASIEFTNIPGTYTDLAVLYSTRVTASGNSIIGYFRFNGNSANYTWRRVRGDGTSAASATNSATTEIYGFYSSAASDTSNTFSNNLIYIPNYTSSNNKSVSCDTASENNGTEAYAGFIAGLWSNSAAITQITFYPNSGDFAQYSTATLYGIGGARASGGTITADARYTYHTFTSSGTFTALEKIKGAEVLLVAGGGSGGRPGGGGGAGGFRTVAGQSFTAGASYSVTVGGGASAPGSAGKGSQGSNSSVGVQGNTLSSTGGGGGGYGSTDAPTTGGSGGGAGRDGYFSGASGNAGGYTPVEGYAGGSGPRTGFVGGSGGGGAGAVGGNGGGNDTSTGETAGAGGAGSSSASSWGYATSTGVLSGGIYYYAGGGGGGNEDFGSFGGTGGAGGTGGGGAGSANTNNATSGTANTGGGGGGSGRSAGTAGAGGSGLVIIRYPN